MSEPDLSSDSFFDSFSDILEASTVEDKLEDISSQLHDTVEDLSDITDTIHELYSEQSTDLGAVNVVVDTNLNTSAAADSGENFEETSSVGLSVRQAIAELPPKKLAKSCSANSSPVKTRAETSTQSYSVKDRIQFFDPVSCTTRIVSRSLGNLSESSKLNPPIALRSTTTVIGDPNLDINKLQRQIRKQKALASAANSDANSENTQTNMALAKQNAIYNHHNQLIQTQIDELTPKTQQKSHSQEELTALEDKLFLIREYRKNHDTLTRQLNNIIANPSTTENLNQFLTISSNYSNLGSKLSLLQSKVEAIINKWRKEDDILDQKRISIPEFFGIFVDYKNFRDSFASLTKSLSKGNQKIRINEVLKGEARSRVEDLLKGDASIDEILKELDDYYSDPKQITDVTIRELYTLEHPIFDLKILDKHFTNFKNKGFNVLTLDHTPEQLLVAYYLTIIPGKFRTLIERELPKEKTKFTFADIRPIIDTIVRRESHDNETNSNYSSYNINASDITAAPASIKSKHRPNSQQPSQPNTTNTNTTNTTTNQQYPPQGQNQPNGGGGQRGGVPRGRGRGGGRGGYRKKPSQPCRICQSTEHAYSFCDKFSQGQEMRDELTKLKLCLNCIKPHKFHGTECELYYPCSKCKTICHQTITCGGSGDSHPGSQFLPKPASS